MITKSRPLWPALAVLALGAADGCQRAPDPAPGDDGAELPDPSGNADELFTLDHLPKFHVALDDAALASLAAQPKEYVSGTFRYEDFVFENVGVRFKGNFTLQTIDEKPSLKVKVNKFVKGRRFFGLEGLTLHNMVTDPSMVREWLAYTTFRGAGGPAQRGGYAEVFINDEPYGVYFNVETPDDEFLAHNYADPTGELYEGEHGDDLDGDLAGYEQDEGDDTSRAALMRFSQLATADGDGIFFAENSVLDTQQFLQFVATEALVGHFDGYWSSHNHFIYHEPASDLWTFFPWSLDQTWVRQLSPYGSGGYLSEKCLASDRCRVDYVNTALGVADMFEQLDLRASIDEIVDLIDDAARDDPRQPFSNSAMDDERERISRWIDGRYESYTEPLECLVDGSEPDDDGDGWGACVHDCDDDDSDINPDAEEICDDIDNDCSGYADDVPECPCPSTTIDGVEFFFCTHVRRWTEAEAFCQAQGHDLARIDDPDMNRAVWVAASAIKGGRWAIGLSDRQAENEYRWPDGTVAEFTAWASGEPAHALDWFDCVFYGGGSDAAWRELNCKETGPFICRARP